MDDFSGQILKGYELRQQIGIGGFGAVYRAFQPAVEREVAIKIILPEHANQPDFIRRFETEAQIVARLEHLHIVPLYDFWRAPDGAYLVMRYYRGGSLRTLIDTGEAYDLDDIVKWVSQISSALTIAHRNGVIHRDMKPDNILLDNDGNAYLTDFGIAKTEDTAEEEAITGTWNYISPEQITSSPVSPQTDIYSFGIMIYELLTGELPFKGPNLTQVITDHLSSPVPPLTDIRSDLPDEINNVIRKATEKQPGDRYTDAVTLAQEFRNAVKGVDQAIDVEPLIDFVLAENPYKGLRPFEEADSADFFGRHALINQLTERLSEDHPQSRFLAVVGPSGSGKSSVVKAGLIPTLRDGNIPGSEGWFFTEMIPGTQPLDELKAALLAVAHNDPGDTLQRLHEDPQSLIQIAKTILPNPDDELLLVIDQFEEIFTLARHEADIHHFLKLLTTAIQDPDSHVRVIITLRADFYDRPLLYPAFGALMRVRTEVVLPLNADELEQAITGPATRVGVQVDADLVATIVSDVSEEPGMLPLLQYVLTEIFERRENNFLTLEAYQNIGGVIGALAQRAEEIFNDLGAQDRSISRQIFLRLVALGEGTEDTRRRVSWSELMSLSDSSGSMDMRKTMQYVLDTFSRYRLLTSDRDPITREPTIEVAHEALIREWWRLREWLNESRVDVRSQRLLAGAAREWLKANQESSFLLTGARLAQFEEWSQTTNLVLTQDEYAYLNASFAQRDVRIAEEEARKAHEEKLERRDRQRLRVLVSVTTLAAIVAVILMTLAFTQSQEAQVSRDIAQTQVAIVERNAAETFSQALADQSLDIFQTDPQLAIALALEANSIDSPPAYSQNVLTQLAYRPGMQRQFNKNTVQITDIAISPDNKTLLTASFDAQLILWDIATQTILQEFAGHALPITSIAISPDGTIALSGSLDKTVRVWDMQSGQLIREFTGHDGVVNSVAISPDGRRALSGAEDNNMILWNIETGSIIQTFSWHQDGVTAVAFHPQEAMALSAGKDNKLILWDTEVGVPLHVLDQHTADALSAAFSPDGTQILASTRDEQLLIWDVASGEIVQSLGDSSAGNGHTLRVNSLAFSPDGRQAITASDDTSLIIWDIETGTAVNQLWGHAEKVSSVVVANNGQFAVSGAYDGTLILWDIGNSEILQSFPPTDEDTSAVNSVAFDPGSDLLFSATEAGNIHLSDSQTGEIIRSLESHSAAILSLDVSPNGEQLIGGTQDNLVIVWDVASGEIIKTWDGHSNAVTGVAFSPDGETALSGSADATLILWDIATGEAIHTLTGHNRSILSIAFSPDGETALSGSADNTLILWDIATGETRHVLEGHKRRVLSVAYSPDSKTAISGSLEGRLIVWNLETGQSIRQFDGHERAVYDVAVYPDGQRALSAGDDDRIIVWDMTTGEELHRLAGYTKDVISIAINAEGNQILSGTSDGRMTLWQTLPLPELIDWVYENRFIRELTCEERTLYRVQPLCDSAN